MTAAAAPDAPAKQRKVPMVGRQLRVPRELWEAAAAQAAQEDPPRSVSDVVRAGLEAYTAGAAG